MADAELEEIRRARLAQLQRQRDDQVGQDTKAQQEEQAKADKQRAIIEQILEPDAFDRLGRIRLVNESRATDVENRLIMLAQSGQLGQRVTETQLKQMLRAIAEKQRNGEENEIVFSNRRGIWDDDDDDGLFHANAGKQRNERAHRTANSRHEDRSDDDDDDDLLDL